MSDKGRNRKQAFRFYAADIREADEVRELDKLRAEIRQEQKVLGMDNRLKLEVMCLNRRTILRVQ